MRGVHHIDHLTSTCRLERRSKTRYYLRPLFDLWDIAAVNAYMVYGELTLKKLAHLDFQVIVAKSLIGNYNNQRGNPQKFRTTKRVSGNFSTKTPSHLPELVPSHGRCHYCKNQGKQNETFVKCNTCGVFLCSVASASGRSCFCKHHLQA